ncbi:MAG: hypothetical protein K2O67_01545, partial [Clostridia bacterium]|nr:hypothetical protein [Clostridia bacterium]
IEERQSKSNGKRIPFGRIRAYRERASPPKPEKLPFFFGWAHGLIPLRLTPAVLRFLRSELKNLIAAPLRAAFLRF